MDEPLEAGEVEFLMRRGLTKRTLSRTLGEQGGRMRTMTATKARSNLYGLLADVNRSSEAIVITGKNGNGVLLSEDDYRAIRETLYLLSVPGMRESIREGLDTPLDECSDAELEW